MPGKTKRSIEARLDELETLVKQIDHRFERVELVTTVREPNTGMSADAYNGLRKQVIAAVGERTAHLQQLAQFDAALKADATMEQLGKLVEEWLAAAGLQRVEDASVADAFDVVGPADGTDLRVVRPAYVDANAGRLVRGGVAERYTPEVREPVDARVEETETEVEEASA